MELIKEVENFVAENIGLFHESRLKKLQTLKLNKLLEKKNPYLYRAKNLNTPQAVVEALASAFMSSAEESMFGDWLEKLAVFVSSKVFGGYKSSSEGIDMEMDKNGVHYVVSIKSGPNWCNSSSLKKLKENFMRAKRAYRTGGNKLPCEAVEGYCYGRDDNWNKISHFKLCGERFWTFISDSSELFVDIVEPLGTEARRHNDEYEKQYNKMITLFTREFANNYCSDDGSIDWDKIVRLNSGIKNNT